MPTRKGLPTVFANNLLWVGDSHRTHPWSLKPGGWNLVVAYYNGDVFGYDKIKVPSAYLAKVDTGDDIRALFLSPQGYKHDHDAYQAVWVDGLSKVSPIRALKPFDHYYSSTG